MIGIIFDVKTIKGTALQHTLGSVIDQSCNILFVAVDDDLFKELDSSQDRKAFVNSEKFISGIHYTMCTIYNEKNQTISIEPCSGEYIQLFLDTVSRFFEDTVTIVASYNDIAIDKGFSNPVICGPSGEVCLLKRNTHQPVDQNTVKAQYNFLVSQKDKPHCGLILSLEQPTVDFLQNICNAGVTNSNGTRSQKEFFGRFIIKNTKTKGDETIVTLEIDHSSLKAGGEDDIDAKPSLYNFHSHPHNAYMKYRVNYGPPSVQDYKSVFILVTQYSTVVHFVASLEGLYVISFNPEKRNLTVKQADKIIEGLEYKDVDTLGQLELYIEKVNRVGLFSVKLIPWSDSREFNHIEVEFLKTGEFGNCLLRD